MDEKQRGNCRYTPGLNCDTETPNCAKCGWNPKCAARRLKKIKEKRANALRSNLP